MNPNELKPHTGLFDKQPAALKKQQTHVKKKDFHLHVRHNLNHVMLIWRYWSPLTNQSQKTDAPTWVVKSWKKRRSFVREHLCTVRPACREAVIQKMIKEKRKKNTSSPSGSTEKDLFIHRKWTCISCWGCLHDRPGKSRPFRTETKTSLHFSTGHSSTDGLHSDSNHFMQAWSGEFYLKTRLCVLTVPSIRNLKYSSNWITVVLEFTEDKGLTFSAEATALIQSFNVFSILLGTISRPWVTLQQLLTVCQFNLGLSLWTVVKKRGRNSRLLFRR